MRAKKQRRLVLLKRQRKSPPCYSMITDDFTSVHSCYSDKLAHVSLSQADTSTSTDSMNLGHILNLKVTVNLKVYDMV